MSSTMGLVFHTPEERWERITHVLLGVAAMFGVFTVHGIYSHDDWRGLVMTIAPGAVCFGLWYLARARLDYLVGGTQSPLWIKIGSWTFVGVGVLMLVLILIGLGLPPERQGDRQQEMLQRAM